MERWNSFFSETDFLSFQLLGYDKLLSRVRQFDRETQGIPVGEKILYHNFKTYLFDDLLPKMDRMSMYHGLEVRSPFLDKALIDVGAFKK